MGAGRLTRAVQPGLLTDGRQMGRLCLLQPLPQANVPSGASQPGQAQGQDAGRAAFMQVAPCPRCVTVCHLAACAGQSTDQDQPKTGWVDTRAALTRVKITRLYCLTGSHWVTWQAMSAQLAVLGTCTSLQL